MPESDLALLIRAAEEAGRIATRARARGLDPEMKPQGAGPVTEADLETDRYLRETLLAARPGYGWLSEETPDDAARLSTPRQFIVDPIDGTRAFIEGSKDWAHSLAVAEAGEITAAVVYLPDRGALYAGARGGGATLNGEALSVSSRESASGARVLANRGSVEPHLWPGGLPPFTRTFRSSLAYRLCLVAQGRFDAMVSLRPTWEWDVAAGALIVAEARGRTGEPDGAPLRFNTPEAQSRRGILAAGGLWGVLQRALDPSGPDARVPAEPRRETPR